MPTRSLVALAAVILAQVVYHVAQKLMPTALQPFAVLTLVYALATLACLAALLVGGGGPVAAQLRASMVLPTLALAASVVGIEVGFLLLYRLGGALSSAYAASSAGTVVILFLIAALWVREPVTARQMTGVSLALLGIWFATTGR